MGKTLPDDKHLHYSRIINFTSHTRYPMKPLLSPRKPSAPCSNCCLNT
jgi:hypothetical protein